MKIAMLHLGEPHPSHRGFGEAVSADFIRCTDAASPHSPKAFVDEAKTGSKLKEYDVLIAEGARPLYTGIVSKIRHGTTLIYLCADHRFHQLASGDIQVKSLYSLFKFLLGQYGLFGVKMIMNRYVDGVVAVSEFVADFIQPIVGYQTPITIAHPFIQEELYEKLGTVTYHPESDIVTTVGYGQRYKGTDLLVSAWKKVHEKHPEAELHIVGKGHPTSYEDTSGVTVMGYLSNISEAYDHANLYVQPSRVDPFPVSVLEALRAGVPTLVTESTGSKSEVQNINTNLVCQTNPRSIAQSINWYLSLEDEIKRELSTRSSHIGSKFNPNSRKEAFRLALSSLLENVPIK
jgi:glycosyltransferase involved in cell wall biosynthesis